MGPRASALMVAAALAVTSSANADEPVNVLAHPRLPAPLILPELTHPRRDLVVNWTVGSGSTNVTERPNAAVALMRAQFEDSFWFWPRRLYGGVTWEYASALPPDKGIDVDDDPSAPRPTGMTGGLTNPELHARLVFPLAEGLTIGFGTGAVLPISSIDRDGPATSAMLAAASIEPTEYVHFLHGRWGIRPFGDLRIVRGVFVFQAREGFDILIDGLAVERAQTAGRILAHAGVTLTRALELSVEATQIYFFFSDPAPDANLPPAQRAVRERYRISDDRRSAFTIGPSLRLSFPNVDLGIGLVSNLFQPLSPALDSVVAARVSLVAHFR